MIVTDRDFALDKAKKTLMHMGFMFSQAVPLNKGRYQILEGRGCCNILLIYKHEMFLSYGKQFKHKGRTGIGESINREHLRTAFKYGCKLIARVDSQGDVLLANMGEFRESGMVWTTKEKVEVVSNTIHLFKRYDSFDDAYNDVMRKENTLNEWVKR